MFKDLYKGDELIYNSNIVNNVIDNINVIGITTNINIKVSFSILFLIIV